MYTAKLLGESSNKQTQRHTVTIEFSEGVHVFPKDFSFGLGTSLEVMKKVVKTYLDEINLVIPEIPLNTDMTAVTAETPTAPTQAELDKQAWEKDRADLRIVMELVRDGVWTGAELPVKNLQAKVRDGFKAGYLG